MSNRYARILAATGAVVLGVTLGVPAAMAAGTWTVQPGGAITALTGLTIIDTRTGTQFDCRFEPGAKTDVSGTLKSGSGLPGADAGSLSAVSADTCLMTRRPYSVIGVQAADLPWHVNLSSYNPATGEVTGTISHIHLTWVGSGCTFDIDGTGAAAGDGRVRFLYWDSIGGRLKVLARGSNLHFYDVGVGCKQPPDWRFGLFKGRDPATMTGGPFVVNPRQAITSP
jgi:hypothetical protein